MAKLFIAEDDPLMSRMYERAFRLGGHELTMAFDGEEALASLGKMDPKPALIILDVMMRSCYSAYQPCWCTGCGERT
jgi:DNA-binding response OmpR family regulator